MKTLSLSGFLAPLLLALPAPAGAALVYSSFPDLTAPAGGTSWCSSCGGSWRIYDGFSVAGATSVKRASFRVALYQFPGITTVSINGDDGGIVGAELFSADILPDDFLSVDFLFDDTALVTVGLPGWGLSGNAYWFSVYNRYDLIDMGFDKPGNALFQAYSADPAGGGEIRPDQGTAFALYDDAADVGGAVPEPASWAMMIAGLGAVGGAMRGRRTVVFSFA